MANKPVSLKAPSEHDVLICFRVRIDQQSEHTIVQEEVINQSFSNYIRKTNVQKEIKLVKCNTEL